MAQPRLSIHELDTWLRGSDHIQRLLGCHHTEHVSNSYIADRVGVPRATVCRWRREGVPLHQADRIAIALDLHPSNIWPDFHEV